MLFTNFVVNFAIETSPSF